MEKVMDFIEKNAMNGSSEYIEKENSDFMFLNLKTVFQEMDVIETLLKKKFDSNIEITEKKTDNDNIYITFSYKGINGILTEMTVSRGYEYWYIILS